MNEILQAETPPSGATVSERLKSLDAYRGLIMITLAFGGFGLASTAGLQLKISPESQFWTIVQNQCVHAQWIGCRCWDMIQPSFMFMVGVSLAYSYAKRRKMGHSYVRMLSHACWRSIVLVFLGVFLSSNGGRSINWTFANVLCQIGLGYSFLFLLSLFRNIKIQVYGNTLRAPETCIRWTFIRERKSAVVCRNGMKWC